MQILKVSIAIFLITFLMISISLAEDGLWEKVGEVDGIVGYTRPTTLSRVAEIKAVGIVDAPIAVVEAVIRDVALMPQYMFLCKEAYLINTHEMKSSGDIIYFYSLTDLPFPVQDRDVVGKSIWSVNKTTGAIHCHMEAVETMYKRRKDVVRIPLSIVDCTLIPLGNDKTEVIYQVMSDPGGELPSSLVSLLIRDYGIKTIAGLRHMVKKDQFKNVRNIVTSTIKVNH